MFFALYIKIKAISFESKYEKYINGSTKIIGSSPSILVDYEYKDRFGIIKTSYYSVPSLYYTPEWREIELLKIVFFLLLPWSAPLPSKKKEIYTKVA